MPNKTMPTDTHPHTEPLSGAASAAPHTDASEEMLRAFAAALPDLAFVLDEEGRYVDVLNPDSRLLYREAENIKGRLIAEVLPPEITAECLRVVRQTLATQKPQTFRYQLDVIAGPRQFEAHVAPLPGMHHGARKVIWLARDITQQLEAEQALRASREHYQNLDRISRVLARSTGTEEMLRKVVQEMLAIFKADRAWFLYPCNPDSASWHVPVEAAVPEYPGAFALNLEVPTDAVSAKIFRAALASAAPVMFDFIQQDEIGDTLRQFNIKTQIVIALRPLLGEPWLLGMHQCSHQRLWTEDEKKLLKDIAERIADSLTNYVLFNQLQADIARRKQIEASLKESEARLQAILDHSTAIIYVKDLDLRFTLINRHFEEIFDINRQRLIGKTVHELFPKELADPYARNDRQVLEQLRPITFEERAQQRGGMHTYLSTKFPLLDSAGIPYALCGISTDITERKAVEERTQSLLEQNRRLTQRLYTVQEEERQHLAHELHDELSQYIAAINLHAQAIANLPAGQIDKIHSYAEIISASARHIQGETRGMVLRLRPAALDELGLLSSIQEHIDTWSRQYPDIHCKFTCDTTVGDLGETINIALYRIIQEALTNIAKHSRANQVSIALRHCRRSGDPHNRLCVIITDNGVGFDPGARQHGFGLTSMRERVAALGGELEIRALPNQGVTIVAAIPLPAAAAATRPLTAQTP